MLRQTESPRPFAIATDSELDAAMEYVAMHKQHQFTNVNKEMLRVIFKKITEKREPCSKLALLAATIIREEIPPKHKEYVRLIEAYTSAVMKIMSLRSTRARRRRTAPTTEQPATVHPVGKHGQLILL